MYSKSTNKIVINIVYARVYGAIEKMTFTCSSSLNDILIDKNDKYLIKSKLSGVKKLSTLTSDVNIYAVRATSPTIIHKYGYTRGVSNFEFSGGFSYNDYYIIFENKTSESKTFNLSVFEIEEELHLGVDNEYEIKKYYNYYKFTTGEEGGQYIVSVLAQNSYSFVAESACGQFIGAEVLQWEGYYHVEVSCNPNQTYYFGISAPQIDSSVTAIVHVEKASHPKKWEILGGPTNSIITYEDSIFLQSGYEYTVRLWIDDEFFDTQIRIKDFNEVNYENLPNSDGKLFIPFGKKGLYYISTDYHSLTILPLN